MNSDPPHNAADAFATAEPFDLAAFTADTITADNAFEPSTLQRAANAVRDALAARRRRRNNPAPTPQEHASSALMERAREVLGVRFASWEREVLMLAALPSRSPLVRIPRGDDSGELVRRLRDALAARHCEAGIYRRADSLVIVTDDGSVRCKRIPPETLAERADSVVAVFDFREGEGGQLRAARVRALTLRGEFAALVGEDLSSIPELRGFVFGPILRPDGTVFEGEGFDIATSYYARSGLRAELREPTPTAARLALDALLCPLADFPFEGLPVGRRPTLEELRANPHAIGMVAAVLTAVCRASFDGPAPGFLIEANTPGAGKSLLAFLVVALATGAGVAVSTLADDEAERRKSIMAKLMEGEPVIALDNAKGTLGGPALESVLTSEWFTDRLLGQTNTVRARNNALWLFTGNNCAVTSDFARRVQPVRLSYPDERPEDRDTAAYAIPDLKTWVHEHRASLVAAAITLVRAFIVAGRPKPARAVKSYGSFEGWDATIRRALLFAGAADVDTARQEFRERSDIERDALADLLRALRDLSTSKHNGGPMYAADILKACSTPLGGDTEILLALRDVGLRGGTPTQKGIGRTLANVREKVCQGLRLEGQKDRNGTMRWSVSEVPGLLGTAGFVSNPVCERGSDSDFVGDRETTPQYPADPAEGGDTGDFTDDVTAVRVYPDGRSTVLAGPRKAAS